MFWSADQSLHCSYTCLCPGQQFLHALRFENQWGLSRGFREQGNKVICFRGTREQKSKTEGNRGTNANLGNGEHRKSRFWFWEQRKMPIFSEEQGNRYPPTPHPHLSPPGRALSIFRNVQVRLISKRVTAQYVSVGWKAYWCTPFFLSTSFLLFIFTG